MAITYRIDCDSPPFRPTTRGQGSGRNNCRYRNGATCRRARSPADASNSRRINVTRFCTKQHSSCVKLKPISHARSHSRIWQGSARSPGEVLRAADTLEWSAEAAKRLRGETLPLDAVAHGQGKFGFTLRIPCGVVVAITPFNFPLNLPCHKVGPALAAGNSVILKPASATPLTSLKLTELLLQAGLPELGIQCLTGHGSRLGTQLVADSRVRKVSFHRQSRCRPAKSRARLV